jgi:hypothetical protein
MNTLLIKLGSLAVHIEEFLSSKGNIVDKNAIETLLADTEVREFLDKKENQVFLPVKR